MRFMDTSATINIFMCIHRSMSERLTERMIVRLHPEMVNDMKKTGNVSDFLRTLIKIDMDSKGKLKLTKIERVYLESKLLMYYERISSK